MFASSLSYLDILQYMIAYVHVIFEKKYLFFEELFFCPAKRFILRELFRWVDELLEPGIVFN